MQHKHIGSNPNSGTNSPTSIIKRRPPLALLKRGSSVVPSPEVNSASSSRESAFSFNQNPRTSLLFGKNNIFSYDGENEKPGYLSLLQDINRLLILKWTPNALLHSEPQSTSKSPHTLSTHLNAVSVKIETITHLHLHKNEENKSICMVLIDSDGVQQFSFKFTLTQQCLAFLKAIEAGLAPLFRIDPSLRSIKFKDTILSENVSQQTICQVNPELARSSAAEMSPLDNSRAAGLVFRIVSFASSNFASPNSNRTTQKSSRTLSRNSTEENSKGGRGEEDQQISELALRDSLANATRAMRNQILGRAFYGWFSYSRHLRTIRTNLASIVTMAGEFPMEPDDANFPVNEVFWKICRSEKSIPLYKQFLMRVYLCGIEPEMRQQTWPYLLRIVEWHEEFGEDDKLAIVKSEFEKDILEWREIEREVELKEKERNGGGGGLPPDISRQNSEYGDFHTFKDYPPPAYSSSVSSDVFDESSDEMDAKTLLTREFATNLSRIQKDVDRCDRTTRYYSKMENLEMLRKIMCTYVYRRLKMDLADGYVQGMCDLLAPLLVIFGDGPITLACFERLMRRMGNNFPQNKETGGMEDSLNYFRCLVEVMEPDLYAQLMSNVDYSFVVFYRWLLLDFKRELLYSEIFQLWEVIWAADLICSRHFGLFFGLALLVQYREILIENEMDFTDVIKFFNEMAEKHDVQELLDIARNKIRAFQGIMQELMSKKD